MPVDLLVLSGITLVAAAVNGAIGYGFSSLTVPVALLFYTNRVLNPALVLIEVVLNAYVLFVNRRAVPAVWRRMVPIILGLPVGVLAGTLLLALVNPAWMKAWTYTCLIPVILFQAAGYRRPLKWRSSFGLGFGGALGTLYSVTTISGPPLAVLLSNQGYAKDQFRAGVSLVKLAQSLMTLAAYASAGMVTWTSAAMSLQILPSLALGVPLGAFVIRHVRTELFRRICMSLDAWLVAIGLASVLHMLLILDGTSAFGLFAAVALVDIWLLYRFLRGSRTPFVTQA